MGSGIAQLAAMAGYEVTLCDTAPEQLERARGQIRASIDKLAAKGRLDREAGEQAVRRVQLSGSLAEAAAGAALVVEAVVEVLAVKQSVLREAVAVARPDALYGTNTSQLSITAIASACPDAADRVIGLHFFNPVVLMRLVEVVRGLQTSDSTVAAAKQFAQALGRETVVCEKDSPGFLTSRISAIVRLECLRMLEEGVGTAEDIDRALRLGLNFPIGPRNWGTATGWTRSCSCWSRSARRSASDSVPPSACVTWWPPAGWAARPGAAYTTTTSVGRSASRPRHDRAPGRAVRRNRPHPNRR